MSIKKEKKREWRGRDIILLIWFLIALAQLHYSILLFFGVTGGSLFFFCNGVIMIIEGGLGCAIAYPD